MTSSSDRIDRIEVLLERSITASNERMTRIEQSMERHSQASNERMTRIEEALYVTDAKVGVLVTCVDELAERIDRVVNYLEGQSGNGRHGG